MNALWAGTSVTLIGLGAWLLWALVQGEDWGGSVTAVEVASYLEFLWKALAVASPTALVATGVANVARDRKFISGTE